MFSRSLKNLSKKHAVAALTVLVLGGGGLAYRHHAASERTTQADSTALALRFTPGTTLHYAVSWSGTQRGRLFAEGAGAGQTHTTTTVDMAVAMDLYVESVRDDEATVRLTFPRVERHQLNALGAEVFPTQDAATAALGGRSARVRIGADGTARDVAFQAGSPDIFINTVQWVVAQSSISLGPSPRGASWDAAERGPFGRSNVHYARTGTGLARTRVRYESFDAAASADLASLRTSKLEGRTTLEFRDGLIGQLHGDESVRVETTTGAMELEGTVVFDLRLLGVDSGRAPGGAVAYGAPSAAGEPVIGADMEAQLINQRIEGMTREQLLADLATMGNGGVMPMHTKWLWRATGLLKKDPALAKELGKLALAPSATDKSRALVLDLLASVGHPEAQAEMRHILGSSELARSGARPVLLQRVSFLDSPEPATVDAVWSSLREGKQRGSTDLVAASAHALAASAGTLAKNGDAAGARTTVRMLGTELAQAKEKGSKVALLSALGNASSPEVLDVAKPYATSDDNDLREAAADALRKVDTKEAVETLLGLLGDPNSTVQGAALASLRDRSLSASDWQRVADLVAGGRIPGTLDGAMLNLATSYLGQIRVVGQIVASIGARPDASNQTRARAHAMLASLPT